MHACMHAVMTRVISLSDEAYGNLKRLKDGDDSFSDVVNRLASGARKKSLLELAGKWSGGREETDKIFKEIYSDRKKFKTRDVNF